MPRKAKPLITEDVFITVTMDAEVFNWLKGMIDAKTQERRYANLIPWYQALVERAAEQFAAAGGDVNEPVSDAEKGVTTNGDKPHKRVIHRRVVKGR